MTTSELKNQATETIKFYVELGNEIFNTDLKMPEIDFNLKGTCGGKYSIRKNIVKINLILFAENVEDYLNQTIPHEVAHAFQYHLCHLKNVTNQAFYGAKKIMPHGKEWKQIMRAFGKDPKRTHSYDVSNAKIRRIAKNHVYVCGCKDPHYLSDTCHKRALRATQLGHAAYKCRICKKHLIYQSENSQIAA